MTALDQTVSFKPESPGVYEIATERGSYSFAANALRKEESDLRTTESGRWGSLDADEGAERELRNIAWVFVLLLLMTLCVHLAVASRSAAAKRV